MTISLYLGVTYLLRDLKTLQTIFDAGKPELVEPLSGFLQPLDIYTTQYHSPTGITTRIQIQVSPEEFALIGIFNRVIPN